MQTVKSLFVLLVTCFALQACHRPIAASVGLPECSEEQKSAYAPRRNEVEAHRQFAMPVIDYPFGTVPPSGWMPRLANSWGVHLNLGVDASGQVVCVAVSKFDPKQPLNGKRRAVLEAVKHWRYTPFVEEGWPVAAMVWETIVEQELPEKHLPLPEVPLDLVRISHARTGGCIGGCPSYRVDLYGDGRAVYWGGFLTPIQGEHHFKVSPQEVARLVELARASDIWSLRPAYFPSGRPSDVPSRSLRISMGAQTHDLEHQGGQSVGMPIAVTKFEEEIDKVVRAGIEPIVRSGMTAELRR